jgi:putative ABC transport system permease protein
MKGLRSLLDFVSYFVSTLMAGGAICAAVNALYCSVDSRRREIATVRALGFAVHAIVASVVIEAMFLGACGAGLGSLASWLLFNGDVISTQGFTFPLRVDGHLVAVSVMWALLIGLIGAVLPSVRAASIPIVTGLRVS